MTIVSTGWETTWWLGTVPQPNHPHAGLTLFRSSTKSSQQSLRILLIISISRLYNYCKKQTALCWNNIFLQNGCKKEKQKGHSAMKDDLEPLLLTKNLSRSSFEILFFEFRVKIMVQKRKTTWIIPQKRPGESHEKKEKIVAVFFLESVFCHVF